MKNDYMPFYEPEELRSEREFISFVRKLVWCVLFGLALIPFIFPVP